MVSLMDVVGSVNEAVNTFVWGPAMLALLMGSGVYLSVRTGWFQVRRFGYIMSRTLCSLLRGGRQEQGGNLTSFQAVTTALAGTVGTGNIAGVTGAMFIGGPGAVFWMWVSALFGMCTKYAEIVLAMEYRVTDGNGVHKGGPMYYIELGMGKGWRWLAVLFAALGGMASFGIGNIAQSNEIAGAVRGLWGVPPSTSGFLLAAVVAGVVFGGAQRIGRVTAVLVPVMSCFYVLAGAVVILLRLDQVPAALAAIFQGAFGVQAVGGGVMGYGIMTAIRQGVARGVFSNEAGLGSAPIAHAASAAKEPVEQALWGVIEVFLDTIVICTITALAVILSGILEVPGGLEAFTSGGTAAAAAFDSILPGNVGGAVIQISLVFFALSSMLSWSLYGERCFGYLSGDSGLVILLYKLAFILFCVVGATGSGTLMWDIADTLNGLMAIPNLVALLALSGVVVRMTSEYFKKR